MEALMTPASATGQVHLHGATSSLSAWRQHGCERRAAGDVFGRRPWRSPAAASAGADGLYGLARRWPAWVRLLLIGGLGLAAWASLILAAWRLVA
jgi:hypothetical protein